MSKVEKLTFLLNLDKPHSEFLLMEANGDLGVALEKHKRQRDAYVQIKHELNIEVLNHDEDIPEALRIPTRMDRLNKINTLSTSQRVSIAIAAMYLKDNQWNVQTAADMLCGHRASHSEIKKTHDRQGGIDFCMVCYDPFDNKEKRRTKFCKNNKCSGHDGLCGDCAGELTKKGITEIAKCPVCRGTNVYQYWWK